MFPENPPTLSIVIPAFNEELRLPETLRKVFDFLQNKNAEVIVVVEKSEDSTLQIAREFSRNNPKLRVLDNAVRHGKGFAVKKGMLAAQGEVVFFMDADLSVPIETVETFMKAFGDDPKLDILVGNRQHSESDIVAAQGWLRRNMGQTFNRVVRMFSGIPLRDTQCGFKAFRKNVAHDLFAAQTINGFAFDVEILLRARQRGYCMGDLPVEWRNSTASKVHIFHDSLRMLWDILRLER